MSHDTYFLCGCPGHGEAVPQLQIRLAGPRQQQCAAQHSLRLAAARPGAPKLPTLDAAVAQTPCRKRLWCAILVVKEEDLNRKKHTSRSLAFNIQVLWDMGTGFTAYQM